MLKIRFKTSYGRIIVGKIIGGDFLNHRGREWGREKSKTLQACLIDLRFFSANPSLLGSFDSVAHAPLPFGLDEVQSASRKPKAFGCANQR